MIKKSIFLLWSILAVLLMSSVAATADDAKQITDANIVGHVVDKDTGGHLVGVMVSIKDTPYGTTTDMSGHYYLRNLKPGRVTVVMSALGYVTQEKVVEVQEHTTIEVNFYAEEDYFNLNEVVVSSNRQQTIRKHAPTLVSVIDDRIFNVSNAVNLAQGLTFQPGIRVENSCQNCGFNQVRINGLDGRFSQILIDSRPVFSALGGVYGLEQLPANMIERVEVVRGGGSALYGSSAIAGVINIITQAPMSNSFSFYNNLTLTGGKNPDNTFGFNASIVGADSRIGAVVFGQARDRAAWDANGDGYSELGKISSRSLGTNLFMRFSEFDRVTAEVHAIQEYRRGGDRLELPDHAASVSERTDHAIYSGNIKYDHYSFDLRHHLQVFGSGQIIERKSYYGGIGDENVGSLGNIPKEEFGVNFGLTKGGTYQGGLQYSYDFDRLLFAPGKILLGAEYLYDSLNDLMPIRHWETDDSGKASRYPEIDQKINVWSQIGQIEWGTDIWTVLLGARLDEHSLVRNDKGGVSPILSPRVTLRYNPSDKINLRASYAKGFRAPQIFDEDLHVGVVQGEAQRVTNKVGLKPEYSHTVSMSADMYFSIGEVQSNFLAESFYTRLLGAFNNEEIGRENGFILYERVNGSNAKVFGVNLEGKMVWKKLSLQAGLTLSKSQWDEAQEWGNRSVLVEENQELPREINTLVDHGPAALSGFLSEMNAEGDREYTEIGITSKEMLRTPNVYGYMTVTYNPVAPLSLSMTLNYTGRMYVPHVVEVGRQAAVIDRQLIEDGLRPITISEANAPRWDRLEESPDYWDLGAKVSYDFKIFNTSTLQLYVGAYNLLNAFQSDFDLYGYRDSGYIHGPGMPRSFYAGVKLDI